MTSRPPDYAYQHRPYVPPTSGLAVTSLVLSLLGFSIFGLIFGAVALPDINTGLKSGKGIAMAGLIIGIIGSAGWLLLWIAASKV